MISTRLNELPRCTVILNGIDAYAIICGGVAARAALLDYHLEEYECRLDEAMRSDRTFGEQL